MCLTTQALGCREGTGDSPLAFIDDGVIVD